ncbi:hypothetical protein ACQ5SO_20210 [Rhodovulum sp. DZ06]|uniref:hypothetical protein n=1 Tax=Rhodovulum sp. DZ06 TaxID=3425126 RepID=UPI003D34613C
MTPDALETVYETLAETLDAVPPEKRELLLAKLALLLAREVGEAKRVQALIAGAAADLSV